MIVASEGVATRRVWAAMEKTYELAILTMCREVVDLFTALQRWNLSTILVVR